MCMVDQLLCGTVLTPAISCTKLKIHSTHSASPLADTFFLSLQFQGRTSLFFTDQETQKRDLHGGPAPLWVSIYTRYLLILFANVESPTVETFLLSLQFYGGQIFTPNINKLRMEICLVDQFSHLSLNETFFLFNFHNK